jgi:hypothetical protein
VLGLRWVSPKIRRFDLLFEQNELIFLVGEVKDAPITAGLIPAKASNG